MKNNIFSTFSFFLLFAIFVGCVSELTDEINKLSDIEQVKLDLDIDLPLIEKFSFKMNDVLKDVESEYLVIDQADSTIKIVSSQTLAVPDADEFVEVSIGSGSRSVDVDLSGVPPGVVPDPINVPLPSTLFQFDIAKDDDINALDSIHLKAGKLLIGFQTNLSDFSFVANLDFLSIKEPNGSTLKRDLNHTDEDNSSGTTTEIDLSGKTLILKDSKTFEYTLTYDLTLPGGQTIPSNPNMKVLVEIKDMELETVFGDVDDRQIPASETGNIDFGDLTKQLEDQGLDFDVAFADPLVKLIFENGYGTEFEIKLDKFQTTLPDNPNDTVRLRTLSDDTVAILIQPATFDAAQRRVVPTKTEFDISTSTTNIKDVLGAIPGSLRTQFSGTLDPDDKPNNFISEQGLFTAVANVEIPFYAKWNVVTSQKFSIGSDATTSDDNSVDLDSVELVMNYNNQLPTAIKVNILTKNNNVWAQDPVVSLDISEGNFDKATRSTTFTKGTLSQKISPDAYTEIANADSLDIFFNLTSGVDTVEVKANQVFDFSLGIRTKIKTVDVK